MVESGKRRSLKLKIGAIVLLSLAVLMLSVIFISHRVELGLIQEKFEKELVVIGDIIGNRSGAALMFDDQVAARRNLNAARFHPYIEKLCLYNTDGKLFSSYLRSPEIHSCTLSLPTETVSSKELLDFTRRILIDSDELAGYLMVTADPSSIETTSNYLLLVLSIFFVLTLLIVLLIVAPIMNKVLGPLAHLRDTAKELAEDPSASIRAKFFYNDEVGDLVKVFNNMLDRLDEESETLRVTEEALRRSMKMEAVGQLTGGIAHDFNNILGIILGNLSLLQLEVSDNPNTLKRVETINKASHRAADLTKKLLGFSSRQSGQFAVTNINRVIEGMQGLIARLITPQIKFEQQLAETLWATKIDPGELEDALLNLVINARDAMSDTSGHLTIETHNWTLDDAYCTLNPDAHPGDYVLLCVTDNGTGIPIELQERIFEPFFSTKAQGKGIGMGLAMIFGFVKRSHGHIKVYSDQGIGTSIHVYLPYTEGEEQPLETKVEIIETPSKGNETILVVDDEKELQELASETLSALGYRILTAGNAAEALKNLRKEKAIDLLFSDVVMPGGMNGYELAEHAAAENPSLKILLTSGFTTTTIVQKSQATFAANLLGKPYTMQTLTGRVRTLLDTPKQVFTNEVAPATTTEKVPGLTMWTEDLAVGIEAIDDDHRILLELLTRAYCEQGDASYTLSTLLAELAEYAPGHFRREESIMKACGYPGSADHNQVHQFLLNQLEIKKDRLRKGTISRPEVIVFLTSWLVNHVRDVDKVFGKYCQGQEEVIEKALSLESRKNGN